ICIYERDIFFDAYLVSTQHPAIYRSSYKNQKSFIGDDYITPHVNRKKPEMSPFTNPIPLMFLKILPEVTIQFQFDVKEGLLTKEQKEELFRRMLLDFGIGAKTNVGYGQFALPEINKSGQHPKSGKSGETSTRDFHNANSNITDAITKSSDPVAKKILAQSVWYGLIIGEKGDNVLLSFDVDDEKVVIKKKKNRITGYVANESQKVRIVFKTAFVNDSPDFSAIVVP
ncbi:MAG TPA: type III-B CRISPR module RAMP protein Cmr6, partial [Bacteroidales bacterium]|nr:type III-B CRISPR module RAMP protein Cmr6 [Bacteroidales bacterium]